MMLVAIAFLLIAFSSLFYTVLSQPADGIMSQKTIGSLCTSLASNSPLTFLNPTNSRTQNSVLSPGGLCPIVLKAGNSNPTTEIDYPLAAVGVVLANLTNQTAANLNSLFIEDSFISFMSSLKPFIQFCFSPTGDAFGPYLECLSPEPGGLFSIGMTSGPWSGYSMISQGYKTISGLLDISTQFFVAELIIVVIMLQIWPYLLFGGLILRTTPFTRKIGGLLIAIALGAVLIYPMVFALEYLTLGSGTADAFATPSSGVNLATAYGFNSLYNPNSITFIPANADPSNTVPYNLNFFVMPNVKTAMQWSGCWPEGTYDNYIEVLGKPIFVGKGVSKSIWDAEFADLISFPNGVIFKAASLTYAAFQVSQFYSGSLGPVFNAPIQCTPTNAANAMVMGINIYGVIGIAGFFIPIINLIITLSAILGLSGMLGGTTRIFGLEKLI
jgi:hypothetical protein